MDRSSQDSPGYKLESQIRLSYGKVIYSQTCHERIIKRLLSINSKIKIWQIILSSITTGSFVLTAISNEKISGIVGSLLSMCLLLLNTFVKNFEIAENASKHQKASDALWDIKEKYISLLTDFEHLSQEEIISKRDMLQKETSSIYKNAPRTDARSARDARKALKKLEDSAFTDKDIDAMLPSSIRRKSSGC